MDIKHKRFMEFFRTLSCLVCGNNQSFSTGHHRIKQQKGGSDDLRNVVPLCSNCYELTHSTNRSQFLREIENRTSLSKERLYDYLHGADIYIEHWEDFKEYNRGNIHSFLQPVFTEDEVESIL